MSRTLLALLAAALLAAGGVSAQAPAPSRDELELLARSLRPEGLAELERNAGALATQPLYEVEASLDAVALSVEGRLRLLLQNREAAPLQELVLRLWPQGSRKGRTSLRASEVRIDGVTASARAHGSVLQVRLRRPLLPGARLALSLRFKGRLLSQRDGDDDLLAAALPVISGLAGGASSQRPGSDGYGTFAAGPHGAVLVDWYPQLAVRSGGRWDQREPGELGDVGRAEPASAVVSLTVPRGFKVAAAGVPLGQRALADGRQTATFAAAGLRGPLGAVASPYYEDADEDAGPVHLRASSMHGAAGARALLLCGRQALLELQRRFGPYPWTNLALAEAALTGGAGGVEQPGLVLVARALSGEGTLGDILQPSMFQFTCWHEVAHQWWQGVVGSDPREAAWIDEALAQHSATLVAEAAGRGGPSPSAGQDALTRHVAAGYQMMRMLDVPDGAVARPTRSFTSPLSYSGLVYGKAPHFFARVRALLGDAVFDEAVRSYRAAWAFREAGPSAFLDAAKATSPAHAEELAALDRRWLHESHGDVDLGPLDMAALLGANTSALMPLLQGLGQGSAGHLPDENELMQLMETMKKTMPELEKMLEAVQGELTSAPGDTPIDQE